MPDELSVVGFDDLLLAAHTVPALTTLRMPIAEIVREGVRQAVALAQDPTAPREARVQSSTRRWSSASPRRRPPVLVRDDRRRDRAAPA